MEGNVSAEKFVYDFAEGNRGSQGPARRQGRQPRRDDESRAARARRLHHHHRGVPGAIWPRARTSTDSTRRSTRTSPTWSGRWAARSATRPTRCWSRSAPGAKFSMPGMMETVLNVGLNDESVAGLSAQAGGNDRFAWDSYRRLIQMFGKTVCDVPGEEFEHALDDAKVAKGVTDDLDLDADDLRALVEAYKKVFVKHTGHDFPQDPREQLDLAIDAVFRSWNADRAVLYRRQERIPADLGTAVNVVAMVFGNLGAGLRHRRRVHPRPGHRRDRRLRRLPGQRPGRGRGGRHPQHRAAAGPGTARQEVVRRAARHHGHPGGPLPRPVRHRVHHRARQAVDAADPGRQAHRRGRLHHRRPAGRRGRHRPGRGAAPGHRQPARPADVPALRPGRATRRRSPGRVGASPGRGGRRGGLHLRPRGRSWPPRARRSSWSAGRPTPTTCPA